MSAESFMERVRAGDVQLIPTDQPSVVKVENRGGEPVDDTFDFKSLSDWQRSEFLKAFNAGLVFMDTRSFFHNMGGAF